MRTNIFFVPFVDVKTATESIQNNVSDNKIYGHCYRPQTKLWEGNVFILVCQSLCLRGGYLPLGPGGCTPIGQTPPKQTPGQTPPPPRDRHLSRRCASYWNAFLLSSSLLSRAKKYSKTLYVEPYVAQKGIKYSSIQLKVFGTLRRALLIPFQCHFLIESPR